MERIIGLLVLGAGMYVLLSLHRDARRQGWGLAARVVLYGSAAAVLVLALLLVLGSTAAAQLLFVGFGALLVGVLVLVAVLAVVAGIVAWRDRRSGPDSRA